MQCAMNKDISSVDKRHLYIRKDCSLWRESFPSEAHVGGASEGTYHGEKEELAGKVPDDPLALADGEDQAGWSGVLRHGLRAAIHHQANQTPSTEVLNSNSRWWTW